MKETRMKSILITLIILLSLFFLVFFNYYYYFVSPQMVETQKIEYFIKDVENHYKKTYDFVSVYQLDQLYYTLMNDDSYSIFNQDGDLLSQVPMSDVDYKQLESMVLDQNEDYYISFALYEKNPVAVLIQDHEEVFIDLKTYEPVFRFRKGI